MYFHFSCLNASIPISVLKSVKIKSLTNMPKQVWQSLTKAEHLCYKPKAMVFSTLSVS